MADPKLPKQLTEETVLDEFAQTGNIYVDSAYTSEEATPAVSPITGEALVFGENTLSGFSVNNGNSPAVNPEDGKAIFVSNLSRGTARGNGHDYFFNYGRNNMLGDIYITSSIGGDFSASPRVADNYYADEDGTLSVYIENSTFGGNLMGFGSQTKNTQKFYGNLEFTFKNSQTQWFCITYGTGYGLGEGNANNNRFGTLVGNIDLVVDGSTTTNNGAIIRGAILPGEGDDKAYLRAYIVNSLFQGEFGAIMNGVEGGSDQYKSTVDVDFTIDGSTFTNVFLMFPNVSTNTQVRDGKLTITGDVNFKATNTRFSGLNMGAGQGGTGWNRTGWIKGDIKFDISGSSNSSRTFIHKGFVGDSTTPRTVEGTLSNSIFGDFTGYDTRENNYIYADTTIKFVESTVGNFTLYNTINSGGNVTATADRVFGTQTLEVTGTTAGTVAGNGPGAGQSGATFNLVFHASDTTSVVGAVSQWNTITVDAGANVRAASLALTGEGSVLTIAIGSSVYTADITNAETLNVVGVLPEKGDTIVVSGLTVSDLGDTEVKVNGGEALKMGILPGQYSISGGDLVIHSGQTVLVNSNYTDGEETSLGVKGYSTITAAQAAINPAETSITIFTGDEEVEPTEFEEEVDVVTKNFTVSIIGDDSESISLNNNNLIIGDATAVDSAEVNVSYTTDIKSVTIGSVTGALTVTLFDISGEDGDAIESFDLSGVSVGDAKITVDEAVIDDLFLADQPDFVGSLKVADSTIGTVYGGVSGLDVDLSQGNSIDVVYAENNGAAIKLGNSSVEKYVAGYRDGGNIDTLVYNDSVSADDLIIGGEDENTIGAINATIKGGDIGTLNIGGEDDTINGNVELAIQGGDIDEIVFGDIGGKLNATLSGGKMGSFEVDNVDGKANVTLAGGTVALAPDGTFYGLVYGASISDALDGGSTGDTLNVEGNAKVGSVSNFKTLNVTGGTLNVAGGGSKSEVSDDNLITVSGDITNRRGINAGGISAANLYNYGLVGVLRDDAEDPGITLTGKLDNVGYIKTANLSVSGNFSNTGKITSVGDITVGGTFTNDGEIYFRSTFSRTGVFSQEGGIALKNVDLKNTGFISAATLSGVKNLTTSKLYVTGGAAISGNITITAGAEVAFTNKANSALKNGLSLGGTITMADTANLIVSGDLTTTGTKTLTVNVGDLIGVNEIVRAEGGVNSWTIKLAGAYAGNYDYVQTDTSVTIYSIDTLFVDASYAADKVNKFNSDVLLYGKNAFATVEEAIAAAKSGARIYIMGEYGDVNAAGFDVFLSRANVGDVTAKSVSVLNDSSVNNLSASSLEIDAAARLTVAGTIPANLPITVDASEGTGSRLVLDVDLTKVTLSEGQVTIIGPAGKSYTAYVLPLEGDNPPAHAGDLYVISNDNVYYAASLFKTENEVLVPNFVDGDTFDAATGDALFAGINTFGDKDQAKAVAQQVGGYYVYVGNTVNNAVGEDDVQTIIEVDRSRGDSGANRAIVGIHDDGNTQYVSDQDHTTMIYGSTSTGNTYGLTRWYDMDGNYKLYVQDSVSTGDALWITGNNHGSVINGNITAEITGSTYQNIYLGAGSFGTDETKPINIDVTIRDSRLNGFYGIHTQRGNNDPANRQDVNANYTVRIYDSVVAGGTITFLNTNNDNYSGTDVTQLQTYYTAGSITLELGGVSMSDGNIRIGGSLEVSGKAFQAFNVPNTVHIVATENSTVTHCNWVCDVDTLIVDANAQLLINNALQYATVDKDPSNPIDYAGTPTQVMINMSGYKSGTHKVIQANYNPSWGGTRGIYTDNELSNISVIGDNDLTGQCELAYLTQTRDGDTYLNAIYVFDKKDDMFVNTGFTDAINGTTDAITGQELLLNYNAHTSFGRALFYANEWGGSITVTGGAFDAQAFSGNNVIVRGGTIGTITMGGDGDLTKKAATLTLSDSAVADVIDGSKSQLASSTLNVSGGAFGAVKDFSVINVAKGAEVAFDSVSGSDLSFFASNVINAGSLNLTGSNVTIDVTGYVGRPHAVIATENGITGFDPTKVTLTGAGVENFGVIQSGNYLVVTTTIKSDTYLNSSYSDATTGTILEDGTYLQYGFNAFSDVTEAAANLGGKTNTLTVTGGVFTDSVVMNGANFVMEAGTFGGIIYGSNGNASGMSITVNAGTIGGIDLTAGDGAYAVTRSTITFGDDVVVNGAVIGGGDTALVVKGDLTAGSLEGLGKITMSADSLIQANFIELAAGSTVYVSAENVQFTEGNLRKIISTQAGISGAVYTADTGYSVYARGNDVYLMDLKRMYFDASYDAMVTGTTMANGDVLSYGVNAFSDLDTAVAAARSNGAMLFIENRNANTTITGTPVVDLTIEDSTIGSLQHGLSNAQNAGNDHEVHVVITNSVVNTSNGFIMGEGTWQNRNTFTGNFTLDVTGSTFGNGRTRIGTFFVEGNKNYVLNFTDSSILGDLSIIEDSPFGNSDHVTVNMTNVKAPVTKWWSFFDGYPGEGGGTIDVNIKDSVLGAPNNGFRFGLQRSCGNSNNVATNVTFTVENSTVNGALAIERIDGNTGNLINYTGNSVLNLIGENKIRYILKFNEVNMTSDASVSGSTMTLRGGNINIDATGYDGDTKAFIYMSNTLSGYGEIVVTGLDDKYTLVQTERAVIASDGTIKNVYYNSQYTTVDTGFTTDLGDILIVESDETEGIANAFTELEDAKLTLADGYKLVVTDDTLETEFYGTLESEEITPYVNVVLAAGNFTEEGSIVAAADLASGAVIDGDSTIEIAGGTFGQAPVLDDEGEIEEEAIFAEINGTREVVGGTSGLLVTYTSKMYANLTDFDYLTVKGDVQIMGDISMVDALVIDCNGSLTVEGDLDAASIGGIRLVSADYVGPTKVVLVSDSLQDIDLSIITVDAPDRIFFDGVNKLYLVSDDPCNVYVDSSYTSAIDGTIVNGELLIYGVNAFSSMDLAIAKADSAYTMYVVGGSFGDIYDLTGKGQLNIQVDAGSIGGFIVDDGGDSDHRSTIRVTGASGSANIGSLSAVEGSTIGYRVVANQDATIGTIDGIQYVRIAANSDVTVGSITYRENGGSLNVDLANYDGASSVVLKVNGGIQNFYQPVAGQTFSRSTVGATNNNGYTLYYDEISKSIIANKFGNVAILSGTASTDYNGKVVSFNGQTTTLAYGYNVSEWNVSGLGANITSDGKLFVEGGFYNGVFYTNNPIQNIEIVGATINGLVAGYNEVAGGSTRVGDYNLVVDGSTFTWFGAFAGRGTNDAHGVFIVGNTVYNEEDEEYEIVDGTYNFTFKNSTHDTNDFFLVRYGNISGGTANVTFEDYSLRGDLQLFSYVWNNNGEQLDAVNVTMTNVTAPASKWMWIWDPQEANQTKITLTITDSVFVGNDHTLGLFGSHANGLWDGEADVYISGLTMSEGRLTGARGVNTGDLAGNIRGTRTLHVSGNNNVALVKEFTTIEIAADAMLTGSTISLPTGTYSNAAFILRGEAGYTGDVKEFAVVGTTIMAENATAKFLDAEDKEIEGYVAVIGATNVFIYTQDGDVYFSNNYSESVTGSAITELSGKKNFLVFGDNAVNTITAAYHSVDERDDAIIVVNDSVMGNLYANGYTMVIGTGSMISNVYGTTVTTEEKEVEADSVNLTINADATVAGIVAATEFGTVLGNATITIGDGAVINGTRATAGTIDGANAFVGGVSTLKFEGDAEAKNITGFDNVILKAGSKVSLEGTFTGSTITIDATDFADFTKKVLFVEGGLEGVTVNVIGQGFGYEISADGKNLLVTSDIVGNAFANASWTEGDVTGKFAGDTALVWNKNAFASVASAAAAVGADDTLFIEGGNSTEAATITNKAVVISENTAGTSVGALTATNSATLTVESDIFTAESLVGFGGISLKAGSVDVTGGIVLANDSTITIDVTDYELLGDTIALSTGTGITGLTDTSLVVTGEGAGSYYAYYNETDGDVHLLRIDNYYVDVAFGTAGEGIVEGQTNPITGETLLFGVNAFYYLNDVRAIIQPGQGLFINNRTNSANTNDVQVSDLYITGSSISQLVGGYTTGNHLYYGDVNVTIKDSTVAYGGESWLISDSVTDNRYDAPNRIFGDVNVLIENSQIGNADGTQTLHLYNYTGVYGAVPGEASTVTMTLKNTSVFDDILFIGDSEMGNDYEVEGATYSGVANLVINMDGVTAEADKAWRIRGGSSNSHGTVTVNVANSVLGSTETNAMRFAIEDNWGSWNNPWGAPDCSSEFIFNVSDTVINGYLLAGRYDISEANDQNPEIPTYTGNRILTVTGDTYISQTRYFKELHLTAESSFTGSTLRMYPTDATISVDVTGYTGASKVLVAMENAFENIQVEDISLTKDEGSVYQLVTDFDAEAEAPAITVIVLKGAMKNMYASADYSEETVTLGTTYNGEALFFGENAFEDVALAINGLTEGANLYATGNVLYTGSDVITVSGDLVNEGSFVIAAAGFVDGSQSDVTVLTANSISGKGTFRTDDSRYTVSLVENTVHLVLKKVDVFVNTAWANLEKDAVVEIPGGTAIIGTDAFATADEAASVVSANGTITILSSEVEFTNAIARNVIATDGSTVKNANIGATSAGALTLQSGAVATNANVRNGSLTVEAGAAVNGSLAMLDGVTVAFADGSALNIDISSQLTSDSAVVTNYKVITGAPSITLTVDAEQAEGVYQIATEAASFNATITLQTAAAVLGTITVGTPVEFYGSKYTLAITDNSVLTLTKEIVSAPINVAYANSAWEGLELGTVVTPIDGYSATIGVDAFATGDAATAAVSPIGEVKVVGGVVSFANGITKKTTVLSGAELTNSNVSSVLTIESGAKLSGKAVFADTAAITIDGTVAFDTAYATATEAQFAGFSVVSGEATYILNAAAAAGTYLLASGISSFTSSVSFQGYELVAGGAALTIDDFTYQLSITANNELALTITEAGGAAKAAKADINGNGISDVMFVWTGNNYQHGFWMDGTSTWQSQGGGHPAEWENLGCYDMSGDGKADSVLVGNVVVNEVKGAYIGYYADAIDAIDGSTWTNIGYLNNADDIDWKNKVGNLTGNASGANSIVWYAPELYALGAWTDGTDSWVTLSNTFGGDDWKLVGCGDFDGDGKDSVVMSGANGTYLYTADIDGTVNPMGNAQWTNWEIRAIGDFSGDGKDDMVAFHQETGSMVMFADGNIDNYTSIGQLDAADWFVVGAGDYNGDKQDDLLVRQYSTGMLGYYTSGDTTQWQVLGYGVDMDWTVIA